MTSLAMWFSGVLLRLRFNRRHAAHLVFGLSDDTSVETNEEMIGFAQLIQELPRRFVGMDRAWFDKVAQPPFESRPTSVWLGAGPAHEDAP